MPAQPAGQQVAVAGELFSPVYLICFPGARAREFQPEPEAENVIAFFASERI